MIFFIVIFAGMLIAFASLGTNGNLTEKSLPQPGYAYQYWAEIARRYQLRAMVGSKDFKQSGLTGVIDKHPIQIQYIVGLLTITIDLQLLANFEFSIAEVAYVNSDLLLTTEDESFNKKFPVAQTKGRVPGFIFKESIRKKMQQSFPEKMNAKISLKGSKIQSREVSVLDERLYSQLVYREQPWMLRSEEDMEAFKLKIDWLIEIATLINLANVMDIE